MIFAAKKETAIALTVLAIATTATMESDYIIVGAGTSGLVVANRLSENPDVTVAVIDPGSDERNNAAVKNPLVWTSLLSTPVAWQYNSTPQETGNGRTIRYLAGKGIGGTSLINGRLRRASRSNTAKSR